MAIKEAEDDDNGGISFLLFTCIVLLVSSVVFVLATATASSSFFPAVFEVRLREDSNATDRVVDLQRNLFIAAATKRNPDRRDRNRSRSLNSSDSSASPVLFKLRNKLEKGLARARVAIRKAAAGNSSFSDHIYRNPAAFYQSYVEMEKRFKVYIYEEGELPIVHSGPCKNIYSSEGRFIVEMEQGGGGKRFRTRDPNSAHAFFMPFSVTWMVKYLYKFDDSYDIGPLKDFAFDYVKVISTKHPFWNRTQGADHFMLSCHDWGPRTSQADPYLYNTSMRVLCNANSSEGFNPRKDVSLPEVNLYDGNVSPKINTPPPPHSPRPYLGFFAGGLHGPIRPTLLRHWKGKDPEIPVYEYLPENLDYYSFLLQSRFCLCPSGYEVASPRIVEAIYAECVPVILSDHYVLPFSDVLKWEAFSVKVEVSEIPRLKEILTGISPEEFSKLKQGLRAVRKHFVLNQPAQRFDMFHMILHSIWLRRINFIHDDTNTNTR